MEIRPLLLLFDFDGLASDLFVPEISIPLQKSS